MSKCACHFDTFADYMFLHHFKLLWNANNPSAIYPKHSMCFHCFAVIAFNQNLLDALLKLNFLYTFFCEMYSVCLHTYLYRWDGQWTLIIIILLLDLCFGITYVSVFHKALQSKVHKHLKFIIYMHPQTAKTKSRAWSFMTPFGILLSLMYTPNAFHQQLLSGRIFTRYLQFG